ncbi:RNA-guided endonuclease InsQ/TnpB family protein [Isoptericola cucumis]|uniref:RNA-guided endonuclease InsQ/TnpB family protein n=1 Tax=Isoptericola cucumis TaxID=1776856 RepID=UPI001669FFD0|nr:RNA-guided endonuclease TnpB family protein [Isoptericola cucumis]
MSVTAGSVLDVVRHTTFQLVADPTVEQARVLARHEGAARFAFNQGLRLHLDARHASKSTGPDDVAATVKVPWTGFDLINAFNAWKRSEDAGRRFVVDGSRAAEVEVTGLAWRTEVSAQVFEEAVVDLGKALKAWTDSRRGKRAGRTAGHPRFKKKNPERGSFRMRNKVSRTKVGDRSTIRVGENGPRSVTLPGIGAIKVHDDTRRLRRMLATGRARILFATVSRRGGRWRISLNVEATDLHPAARHQVRDVTDHSGWAGVDRGLHAPVVAALADGTATLRIAEAPKALRAAQPVTRRLSKSVSRKAKGSVNRRAAVRRLARHHERVRARRHHFLHQVSNLLVQTHDRLVIEDLNITGMLANHRLAAAISDAAWGELARQITYKMAWRGGQVLTADRWFASSKTCSTCGDVTTTLTLADRVFVCDTCGLTIDRDLNAAVNLATWGEQHHHSQVLDPEARGQVTNAHRPDGAGRRSRDDETSRDDVGTRTVTAA